jgi:hypothetical protein
MHKIDTCTIVSRDEQCTTTGISICKHISIRITRVTLSFHYIRFYQWKLHFYCILIHYIIYLYPSIIYVLACGNQTSVTYSLYRFLSFVCILNRMILNGISRNKTLLSFIKVKEIKIIIIDEIVD